jgi:hypothetical protein
LGGGGDGDGDQVGVLTEVGAPDGQGLASVADQPRCRKAVLRTAAARREVASDAPRVHSRGEVTARRTDRHDVWPKRRHWSGNFANKEKPSSCSFRGGHKAS